MQVVLGSMWDHVAMVISVRNKNKKNTSSSSSSSPSSSSSSSASSPSSPSPPSVAPLSLRLFEVCQEGVDFYALDNTLDFYLKGGCTVGIRRLKLDRTQKMLDDLTAFAEEVQGRPYKKDYFQIVKSLFGANVADESSGGRGCIWI